METKQCMEKMTETKTVQSNCNNSSPIFVNAVDLEYLIMAAGGNGKSLSELIDMLCINIPRLMENVRRSAIEKNWKMLKLSVHKIKPITLIVGAKSLEEKMELVEHYAERESHVEEIPFLVADILTLGSNVVEQLKIEQQKRSVNC